MPLVMSVKKHCVKITTAVGEGGIAGQQVFNYIEELK